jgi:cell wall-associated NlpC family hydrolase
MLGDILTFKRDGGGHVGLYVGEDDRYYHVLGGNQTNSVSVSRIAKSRLYKARRTAWKVRQPANVRKVFLEPKGTITTNEA